MVAKILLTQNYTTIIDKDDFELCNKHNWVVHRDWRRPNLTYAKGPGYLGWILLHNFIMPKRTGYIIDHINGNGLDNRRENLRYVTEAQNRYNQLPGANNKSGVRGVYWYEPSKKWRAQITVNKKLQYLGQFDTVEEATKARISAEITYGIRTYMRKGG